MNKGIFVTFEGIDGCGKSTQLTLLKKNLIRNGFSVKATREPGGTPLAEKIRRLILSVSNEAVSREAELLLYLAARAQHTNKVLKPLLAKGVVVLCDRFSDSTIAYQGVGRNIKLESIMRINSFATANLSPDLTVLIDLPAKTAHKRLVSSGKKMDRIESEGINFQETVRKKFLRIAKSNPGRIKIVDGTLPKDEQARLISGYCLKVFSLKR